jgi:hypothetical protein
MLAAVTHKVGDPLAFYSVAATIIPVLFLALIYQATALESLTPEWGASAALVALVLVAFGETEALSVLVTQQPSDKAQDIVMLSVSVVFLVVVLHPIMSTIKRMPDEPGHRPKLLGIPRSDSSIVLHAVLLITPAVVILGVVISLEHGLL